MVFVFISSSSFYTWEFSPFLRFFSFSNTFSISFIFS